MRYASRISNQRICVYLDSTESVKYLCDSIKTIHVNEVAVAIRPLKSKNKRVVISNVHPTIPDSAIFGTLSQMGIQPQSRMIHLKVNTDDPDLAHVACLRRQVYIKEEDETRLLPSVTMKRGSTAVHIYFSAGQATCYK
ncbi:hypothetical protein TKK_0009550 [Trichogramma kaykai]